MAVAVLAAVAILVTAGVWFWSGDGPAADPLPPTAESRLGWASGVNGDPAPTADNVDAFATWRGLPADVAVVYTDRSSWTGIVEADWLYSSFQLWPGRLVISQPPYPEGQGTLEACARGDYDEHWRRFGTTLVTWHRAGSIVRLAWEANGDFMYWSATDADAYKTCFQRVATAIRSTDRRVVIEWTINGHGSQNCDGNAINCYPGDDVVDIVGIDYYDQFPAAGDQAEFDSISALPDGLDYLFEFARRHDKLFAVGEWGVVTNSEGGGGDSPLFVSAMFDWFRQHASALAYEAYFNQCGPSEVVTDLFRCGPVNLSAGRTYLDNIDEHR